MTETVLYNAGKILEPGNTATLAGRLVSAGSKRPAFFF